MAYETIDPREQLVVLRRGRVAYGKATYQLTYPSVAVIGKTLEESGEGRWRLTGASRRLGEIDVTGEFSTSRKGPQTALVARSDNLVKVATFAYAAAAKRLDSTLRTKFGGAADELFDELVHTGYTAVAEGRGVDFDAVLGSLRRRSAGWADAGHRVYFALVPACNAKVILDRVLTAASPAACVTEFGEL